MRILVIDDDRDFQVLVKSILSKRGYTVATYSDATSALEHMDDIQPDVLLVDFRLPKINGYEFAQMYAEMPNHAPIVMVSASARVNTDTPGVVSYLAKPFTPSQLLDCLQQVGSLMTQ